MKIIISITVENSDGSGVHSDHTVDLSKVRAAAALTSDERSKRIAKTLMDEIRDAIDDAQFMAAN